MTDLLIIGGGAAGLYCSSLLPEAAVIERGESCGRKLLLTGGGRCNYTHASSVSELLEHYHGSLPFIRKVLYSHTPEDIINRFRKLGIKEKDEDGKIFPETESSHDILSALLKHNPKIIHGKVVDVEKRGDFFQIKTEDSEYSARKILIATGGNAYPQTGSDGSGYHIARKLGHSIKPQHPALAAIALTPSLGESEGVSTYITLKKGRKCVSGMAVITRKGISGPAAENFSHLLNGKEEIEISFSDADMKAIRRDQGSMLVKNALPLPVRLSYALIGELADRKAANLSKKEENTITECLSRHKFMAAPIASSAMSTAGGVSTDEINPSTMESRIVPGLYFAGDIIDVDADCGGYSLTWTFATAAIAAKSMKQ